MRLARAVVRTHALAMTNRIVLSCLLALFVLVACSSKDAPLDDQPDPSDGIGTSPSEPTLVECTPPVYDCGIWVASSEAEADALSQSCAPANVVVYTGGPVTCVDAVTIITEHPGWQGRAFVRRVDARGRALEATCPAR